MPTMSLAEIMNPDITRLYEGLVSLFVNSTVLFAWEDCTTDPEEKVVNGNKIRGLAFQFMLYEFKTPSRCTVGV